ncbi:hypothetical protein T440DRAFT_534498 [Plenodomus tracheiphilus IPT5]|uniref:Rhodopsin domain-containing protein n=1 Tax=Plenodomus tracheiphilus IPT5 TaxID=1408161 RepID=A0A6A7B0C4_9PLEO|nr:hypothetical protein T440DRAFT_534498 [Plenodomus tracheiphilus IPT5]
MPAQTVIQIEQWCEYAIGVAIFFVRFYARFKIVGFKVAYDDIFAFISMLLWTGEAVSIYFLGYFGTYVGLTPSTALQLDDATISSYIRGSKALFTAWLCYATLIWSLKTTVLFFYHRLTSRLSQHKLIKLLGIAIGLSYIVVLLELLLHCRPIHRNWQIVPYAGDQCTLYYANYFTVTILNVLTDIGILAFIPIPLIWKVKIPVRQKILVALLLCSGLFIIAAAIIRCVLSIQNIRSIDTSGVWAIRETFVTIVAINAPCIKPLFSSSSRGGSGGGGSSNTAAHSGSYKLRSRQRAGGSAVYDEDDDDARGSDADSQVKIISDSQARGDGDRLQDKINVTTMVTVQRHDTELGEFEEPHSYSVAAGSGYQR